jgi:hypothetical protein
MSKTYIGIDTGLNGAAVAVDDYGEIMGTIALPHIREIACYSKNKFRSVLDIQSLDGWLDCFDNIERIVAEESPAYNQGATSAYTSGYNSGRLHALCVQWLGEPSSNRLTNVFNRPFLTVAPKTWQKGLFGDLIKETDGKWDKERSIRLAMMRHGSLAMFKTPKRTADGFADACHIAEWGRKQ